MKNKILLIVAVLTFLGASAGADSGFDPGDYKGKVVVIDFWASWCVPCRRSFPWMNEMHSRYEDDGLVIIGVNVDRQSEDAAAFLEKYPASFAVIYDPEGVLASRYGVEVMPTSIIFDRDGELIHRHSGFKVKRQSEYEAAIRTALQLENEK
jgi:cytochrome c biogenesis protein CcmG/thiol:disulfide interchange protein DsbE